METDFSPGELVRVAKANWNSGTPRLLAKVDAGRAAVVVDMPKGFNMFGSYPNAWACRVVNILIDGVALRALPHELERV